MNLLPYSLSALVAFSGVIVGVVLALLAKEEMPTGKKYFPVVQKALVIAIVALLLNHFEALLAVKLVAYLAVVLVLSRRMAFDVYPLLAVAFFLLGQGSRELFTISTLVFLYGFPTGSLYVIKNRGMGWACAVRAGLRYSVFPVAAVLLQMVYLLTLAA